MTIRDRIERAFEGFAEHVLRRRATVVAASLLLVGGLSAGLPRLEIETSFDSYLPRDNAAKKLYDRFRSEFGSGERIVVLLRPARLYDIGFLEELTGLHEALEAELPYLDDLTSLVNARSLVGTPESLISEGLLDDVPRTQADLELLRRRISANPLYRNLVISADASATAIVIELDGTPLAAADEASRDDLDAVLEGFEDGPLRGPAAVRGDLLTTEQATHLVRSLERILAEHSPRSAELFVAGTPLLAHRLGEMLTHDVLLFVVISLGFSALLLFLLFRSLWATLHPLVVVGLSVIGTLGWMGLAGIPLTAVTEILPSLLLAIGIGDAIHIQAIFYRQREEGHGVEASIRQAMGHSGLAVLLTSVTTAASMAAFQAAELQPVIDLGRVAPVGVGLALLLSTTLLPALLSLTKMDARSGHGARRATSSRVDQVLLALGRVGTRHPLAVLIAVALACGVAAQQAMSLHFSQHDLHWLPEDEPIRVATETLNEVMEGAESFELFVEVGPDADLREPVVLEALREIEERAAELRVSGVSVAQSLSLVDVVEETHRALGDDPSAPLALPRTRSAIAQELLLFESAAPDDLRRLADSGLRKTRIAMTVPFVDALHYPRFAAGVAAISRQVLAERGLEGDVTIAPTGLLTLAGEMFDLLFLSMARSYAIAFAVITLLMLLLVGRLRLGLLSTLPNLVPILLVMGFMGWVDAPLDVSSMLVGGILIGVVVDDTIHFAHNFARYREESGCSLRAVRRTLETTGRAMLVTSVVLSIGFLSFTGASLSNIADFGLLCGAGVLLAFLADVVMMPALVALASPCEPGCACHERAPRS